MPAPDAPWLDPDERRTWIVLSALMTKLPAAMDAQLQREAGLSYFEYMVLAGLSEAPERTHRMSDIAAVVSGSLSRLSHVARRLEQQGLITRAACPVDGRYTNATLTDAGMSRLEAAAPGHVTAVRRLVFDALPGRGHEELRDAALRVLVTVDPGVGRMLDEMGVLEA